MQMCGRSDWFILSTTASFCFSKVLLYLYTYYSLI